MTIKTGGIFGSSERFYLFDQLFFITLYMAVTVFASERVTLGFETLAMRGTSQQAALTFRCSFPDCLVEKQN